MNNKKGQILVITLLVLTVIAVITVSLVSLVSKDVGQVVATDKYEEAFNTSENQLKKILDKYSNTNLPLNTIINEFASSQDLFCVEESLAQRRYSCNVNSDEFSKLNISTKIEVKETKEVEDFVLYKDQSLDLDIVGYGGSFEVFWDKFVALEFAINYTDPSGVIRSVKDVYDPLNLYDSYALITDNPYVDTLNIHPFNFKDVVTRDDRTSVLITISEILDLSNAPINGNLISLRITPRTDEPNQSILLNVVPLGSNAPYQIRKFTSKSIELNPTVNTPVANLETKIPLIPQPNNILDYSLITNGVVQNNI